MLGEDFQLSFPRTVVFNFNSLWCQISKLSKGISLQSCTRSRYFPYFVIIFKKNGYWDGSFSLVTRIKINRNLQFKSNKIRVQNIGTLLLPYIYALFLGRCYFKGYQVLIFILYRIFFFFGTNIGLRYFHMNCCLLSYLFNVCFFSYI